MTTIIGYCFVSNGNGSSSTLDEYSLDSTTGIDGTWSTLRAAYTSGTAVTLPDYRTTIRTAAPLPLSVKAVRHRMPSITGSQRIRTMHYYGYRTAASNRLELWHPTLDQPLYLTPALGDFGDVPRATGYKIFSFRVKNLSATLTAQTITVVREMMTDGSPTILSLTDLQYNAGGYGTTATVPNLGPGAISAGIVDARVKVTNLAPHLVPGLSVLWLLLPPGCSHGVDQEGEANVYINVGAVDITEVVGTREGHELWYENIGLSSIAGARDVEPNAFGGRHGDPQELCSWMGMALRTGTRT